MSYSVVDKDAWKWRSSMETLEALIEKVYGSQRLSQINSSRAKPRKEKNSFLPALVGLFDVVVRYWTVAVAGWVLLFELVMLNRLGICCCCCCLEETCWRRSCWLASWLWKESRSLQRSPPEHIEGLYLNLFDHVWIARCLCSGGRCRLLNKIQLNLFAQLLIDFLDQKTLLDERRERWNENPLIGTRVFHVGSRCVLFLHCQCHRCHRTHTRTHRMKVVVVVVLLLLLTLLLLVVDVRLSSFFLRVFYSVINFPPFLRPLVLSVCWLSSLANTTTIECLQLDICLVRRANRQKRWREEKKKRLCSRSMSRWKTDMLELTDNRPRWSNGHRTRQDTG